MRTERQMEQRIENVARRMDRIEQILPTLATLDHVSGEIAASEARMRAYISDALTASEQRTRTHFDVVAEDLRHQIRLVAESVAVVSESVAVLSERLP